MKKKTEKNRKKQEELYIHKIYFVFDKNERKKKKKERNFQP